MGTVISFSDWLATRDAALKEAIQNEVDWSIGQAIRHPIRTLGRVAKAARTPVLNTMMVAPLTVGAYNATVPEIPHEEPVHSAPGEETPVPKRNDHEGMPGVDEMAHYIAERLTKKLYELDSKMTQLVRGAERTFRQWFNFLAHKIVTVGSSMLKPGTIMKAVSSFFGHYGPEVVTNIAKASWHVVQEVANRFMYEPPEGDIDDLPADTYADLFSRRVNQGRGFGDRTPGRKPTDFFNLGPGGVQAAPRHDHRARIKQVARRGAR